MLHQIGRTRTADIGRCWFGYEGGERLSEPDRRPFVFADVDAVVEGLVREAPAVVVGAGIHLPAVHQEPQRCAEVFAGAFVVAVPWRTIEDVDLATLGWVHWHNSSRLHGYLNDLPPTEFEGRFYATQQGANALVGIK